MRFFFRLSLLFVLFALVLPVYAGTFGDHAEKVVYVHDGDSLVVDIPGWPDVAGKRMLVRLYGIDAPELRGKCDQEKLQAVAAKRFVEQQLSKGADVSLRNIRRDKYFRLLADVYVNEQSLSALLVENGLAKPYDGGKKQGWCGQ